MNMKVEANSLDDAVIIMRRVFDAPRELVWAAITDPRHVTAWYGGRGFSSPVCEMDVRPGGHWRHVMRTPDGSEYKLEFVFLEVIRPERLSWQDINHGKQNMGPPTAVSTVTLEDQGNQTAWKLVVRFNSIAERDLTVKMGFAQMVSEGCERLNDLVKALT
jgi:uncharacterized protein YndB with AHSA1/START domain